MRVFKRVAGLFVAVGLVAAWAAPAGAATAAKAAIDRNASFTMIYPTFASAGVDPGNATNSTHIWYWGPLYDTLTQVVENPKTKALEIKPMLASSWKVSADGLTIDMDLRKDVVFHDGTPMTADAVKASLERSLSSKVLPIVRNAIAAIKTVEVVSPTAVKLTLTQPDPTIPAALASAGGAVYNPAVLADPSVNLALAPPANAGTGPYVLSSIKPNDSAVYKRASGKYWDAKAGNFAEMTLKVISDANTTAAAFRSGDADMVLLSAQNVPSMESFVKANNMNMNIEKTTTTTAVLVRTDRPNVADPRIRQAMAYALDREGMRKNLYQGYFDTIDQFFPRSAALAYDPQFKSPYPFSIEKAKAAIKDVNPLPTIEVGYIAGVYDLIAAAIQAQWQAAGLKVNIRPIVSADLQAQFAAGQLDAAISNISGAADPGQAVSGVIQSGYTLQRGDQTLTDLATASRSAVSDADRTAAYKKINDHTMKNVNAIPIGNLQTGFPAKKAYINTTYMPWAWGGGPVIRYVALTKGS